MGSWSTLTLLALPAIFLITSGVGAVRNRKTHLGRGYCHWTGTKAVVMGYCWILLGIALFVLGVVVTYK